jgi:hypothetical protein
MRQTFFMIILVVGTVYGYHTIVSDLSRRSDAEMLGDPLPEMLSMLGSEEEDAANAQATDPQPVGSARLHLDAAIDSDTESASDSVEHELASEPTAPPLAQIDE